MFDTLKKNQLEKMKQGIVDYVQKYSKDNKGEVSFIGIEYFYDGDSTDIGLRARVRKEETNLEEEICYDDQDDEDNYSCYESIFNETTLKPYFDTLIDYIENADDFEKDELIYSLLIDLVTDLTDILKEINWDDYAVVSSDFEVLEACEYD